MKPTITLSPKRIALILTFVVLGLTLASISGQICKYYLGYDHIFGLVRLFYTANETNIPTWYSSSTIFLCSILLATIAYTNKFEKDRNIRHWIGLSIIFLFLSIDEAAKIHEMAINPIRSRFNTGGFFYYAWVIPGIIFVCIVGMAYLKFILHLPKKTRSLFVVAGFVYVGGALGMEFIGGYHVSLHGEQNMTAVMLTGFEEFLEMMGIVIFIYSLLSYIESHSKSLLIAFSND